MTPGPHRRRRPPAPLLVLAVPALALALAFALPAPAASRAGAAAAARGVVWMRGYPAPGTPARYDRVGVLKFGNPRARNVLVLEPGTSGGSAYFAPMARWLVSLASGWQVWSVERRENLLEDQSMLDRAKAGTATPAQLFDYYLGYLSNPQITDHIAAIPTAGSPSPGGGAWTSPSRISGS